MGELCRPFKSKVCFSCAPCPAKGLMHPPRPLPSHQPALCFLSFSLLPQSQSCFSQPLSRDGSWAEGGWKLCPLTFPREVSSFQPGLAQLCWVLSRSKELSTRGLLFPQPKGAPFPVGPGLGEAR